MNKKQYEGLTYKLKLVFPETYPYKAPLITFETPCFHPNVDEHGNICLDILKEKWSSAFSVSTILQSLRSLLAGECIGAFFYVYVSGTVVYAQPANN